MNIAALLACLSFYSALYLIYFFFMQDQQPIFLILAIVLILLSIWLTPYPYERRRQGFDSTLRIGEYFYGSRLADLHLILPNEVPQLSC